jgi:hypothetical protein
MDAANQLMSLLYGLKNGANTDNKGNSRETSPRAMSSPENSDTHSTQSRYTSPATTGINDSHAHCDIFYSTSFPLSSSAMAINSTDSSRKWHRRQSLPAYLSNNTPNYKKISLTTFSKAKQHTYSFMDPSFPLDIAESVDEYDDSFYTGMDMYGEGLPFVSHATLPVPRKEEHVIKIPRSKTMPLDQEPIFRPRPSLSTLTPIKLLGRYSNDTVLEEYMTEKVLISCIL